jgi:1-deoxy-D-xylulose-5-phosphate reductoisomerase
MKAQMGLPDMKLPIQYAMAYPQRIPSQFPRFNFLDFPQLNFEEPDLDTFQNLSLAFQALDKGGTAACALNAANEISNEAFRNEQISFLEIAEINQKVMHDCSFTLSPKLADYVACDAEAREMARSLILS